ncbi:MAG TPA: SUMF1/EgtB/PvdO family nonheme iron enzyme [Polyangium sp.]|nr:SUMF1/EgtB/PvdO family nonheme iron enzyme [Polyangium sp.]
MNARSTIVFPLVLALSLGVGAALLTSRKKGEPTLVPTQSAAPVFVLLPSAIPSASTGAFAHASASATAAAPPPTYVQVNPESVTMCSKGMVLVDGIYCPFVGHKCDRARDGVQDVCEQFGPQVICEGRLEFRRFCIDMYEYPNLQGVKPVVMADWNDAMRACQVEGKRLCTVEEWEFACEGPGMWPYPYGAERDRTACNIDRDEEAPDADALSRPDRVGTEVERIDKRVKSGSMPRCVSPFGVYDMTGNVDEWVDNPQGKKAEPPFRSSLKGDDWGPGRARCRPIDSTIPESFTSPQRGFRCCSDAQRGARVVAAPDAHRPKVGRMDLPKKTKSPDKPQ